MTSTFTVHHTTLEAFFYDEIEHAQERSGKELPEDVEAYVVNLLARYARRPHAAGRKSRALALDYLRAHSESGSARAFALRNVGDRALYITGVVPRSLDRTSISVRYVKGIGEAAYREIAGRGPLAVLGQLAEMFEDIADVIGEVIELGPGTNNLLELYERWRRGGDARDLQRLIDAGVLIDTEGTDDLQ